MTESEGEAIQRAVLRWFSLDTGKAVYSPPMSYRQVLSNYHQLKDQLAPKGASKPSVCVEGTPEFEEAIRLI